MKNGAVGSSDYRPVTPDGARGVGAVDVEALEQERQFLLRSLADLDAERAAGDIDEDDYRTLSDDYTARTAAVLKALAATKAPARGRQRVANGRDGSAGTATGPAGGGTPTRAPGAGTPARPAGAAAARQRVAPTRVRASSAATNPPTPATARSGRDDDDVGDDVDEGRSPDAAAERDRALASRRRWRTAAIAAAVVAFGGVAAWAVSSSSSHRQGGQTITGNAQVPGTPTTVNGIDPRLVQAVEDANKGDYLGALKLYREVLTDDPMQPVALANQGWLEAQTGLAGNHPDLVTAGLASIVQAEKADSNYAEPHFYRGDVLLHQDDAPDAVSEFRTFLALADSNDPNVDEAKTLLQQAITAAGPNVPAGPFAPTTTTP